MGTTRGIKKATLPVLATAAIVAGGGSYVVREAGETCAFVPADVAALSEPTFKLMLADHMEVEGVIGLHWTYDPETGKPGAWGTLYSQLLIVAGHKNFGDLFETSDLDGTDPTIFFVRTPDQRFDHQHVDWRDLQAAGYTIKSTSDVLEPCSVSVS